MGAPSKADVIRRLEKLDRDPGAYQARVKRSMKRGAKRTMKKIKYRSMKNEV